jgi:hypothetical protein
MSSLLDVLGQQLLNDDTLKQWSRVLGTDEQTTGNAISTALPALLGALTRNSAQPDGAAALASALSSSQHDGSILDGLSSFLNSGNLGTGASILGHIFGGRQTAVASGLGQASGLDLGSMQNLLSLLAPLVMGALGKTQREQGFDAGGLSSYLNEQQGQLQNTSGGGLDSLMRLLDADGDGSALDDVAQIGVGLLGKFFGGR